MKLLRDYGLTIVLAVLFLASWLLQSTTGWVEFVGEQRAHGEVATLFGDSGYFWSWMQSTFENWQSEFLQLFTMVVLVSFLIHRGSQQSKDSDEQLRAQLDEMEERLIRIEALAGGQR
ncbi:MAG TPA: DUF6766 family protein [Candidatus Limnocylindria bacterium]|jgi:hypothetical protein|nr:DUF6766 family protein [Candidatus Limnocylindria bacterium]